MPKENKLQSAFISGEISKQAYGRVDQPYYEYGTKFLMNYLPITQGPIVRRPGTRFVAKAKNTVTGIPILIPFQFSLTQNYMIEAGDKYFRFYQNEAQIITSSNYFLVAGNYGQPGNAANGVLATPNWFTGIRTTSLPQYNEQFAASSMLPAGSVLELQTPFAWTDLKGLKWTQKSDTLYLTHPSYPPYKLVRTGLNTWDMKQIIFQDGPFLPLNSYSTIADKPNVQLSIASNTSYSDCLVSTIPVTSISAINYLGNNQTQITVTPNHNYSTGDQVCILGVAGATELNTSKFGSPFIQTNSSFYWVVTNVYSPQSFAINAFASHSLTNSTGTVQPALLNVISTSSGYACADTMINSSGVNYGLRNIAFYLPSGSSFLRYWGTIYGATAPYQFQVFQGAGIRAAVGTTNIWAMGVYNLNNGFPSACCFHQDRLVFNGPPQYPNEIDASMTSIYELYSASTQSSQVNANNALQFNLTGVDNNSIRWLKSNSQGLLVGAANGEWAATPSSQNQALSPTNISSNQVTAFGSADIDALLAGNAALYIQKAQRKVRELLYYWQVGNFRSTNLSDHSQNITLPTVVQIVNQKEPHSWIWALRSDGQLISMTYNRDDVTLAATAGWARHRLGGQSDTAGSPPIVNSMAVIPSGDTTFDELWLVVTRFYEATGKVNTIEYLSKPYDDGTPQELASYFDCSATYNSSILVQGISTTTCCVITANNHGLTNGSQIIMKNCVGLNNLTTDVNGNVASSNPINYQQFIVASASTNTFLPLNFAGQFIDTGSSSIYVGSAIINQMVSSVGGFTWLGFEQANIAVYADGYNMQCSGGVNISGTVTLSAPAAVVNVGYQYNSDCQMLRTHDGSAQGTSIGTTRRVNRIAFMLHQTGDLSFGPSFLSLLPVEFYSADINRANIAIPLFSGIWRDGIESSYGFDDEICFRQTGGFPGMVQAVARFLEEQDV